MIQPSKPVKLTLRRDLRRAIKRGHPWVFQDAVTAPPAGTMPGCRAVVSDRSGRPVARGYVDPTSSLTLRVCCPDPRVRLDRTWAVDRMEAAWAARRRLFGDGQAATARTNAFRLFNGEGDGLPGLVCDLYGDAAVIKLDGPAAQGFWDSAAVAAWVRERAGVTTVIERFRTRGEAPAEVHIGEAPTGPVVFREHGLRFQADLLLGQKTGFFLDQRDNRRRVGRLSAGRTVLNVFGYTGGFSVHAGAGGATHVTTVDRAAPAVADAEANWRLNDLPADGHTGAAVDAFAFFDEAIGAGRTWDIVIVDPPAFAPSKKALTKALGAYSKLAQLGATVTSPGGVLVSASCSAHVTEGDFLGAVADGIGGARRRAAVLELHGQPADHPAPLACPELRYLKCAFLQL